MSATKGPPGNEALRPVKGLLDLRDSGLATLPAGVRCYELNLSGLPLRSLPGDLQVDSRMVLDDCRRLTHLPRGLCAGSLSLRGCTALEELPEEMSTWFLDLTGCFNLRRWPQRGQLHHGSLVLRDCHQIDRLPAWLGRLATLDVAGCSALRDLPEGLAVTRWVDVAGSGVRRLPASLQDAQLRWRGVRVNHRIAFEPDLLTAQEALQESNAEVRRVIIERIGYLRFLREAGAALLHEDRDRGGPRQLLKIDLHEDEPLVGLSCCCPSTGRQYLIRVPPAMATCHQAAAWIAGFDDPQLYHPDKET